jgi:hypothetical protein
MGIRPLPSLKGINMSAIQSLPRVAVWAGFLLAGFAGTVAADVTIEEKSTIEAAIFKAHGNSVENYSADKKRHDSETHCEGFMKMLCGNVQDGEIVRLDKSVSYDLEPKKKRYREIPFPTEAERKEMARRMKEAVEKMKQCAAQQPQQPAVDTSKCQMSPAKVEVKNLGADGQILGHDVHHTAITMTSSCTNKETQEVCDMQFGFDTWLTSDKIAGYDERDAFTKAYLQKIGLIGEGAAMGLQVQQILAPYAEQMKELKAKSADLKGQSLRSAFHVAYGGAKCASAKNAGAAGSPMSGPAGGGRCGHRGEQGRRRQRGRHGGIARIAVLGWQVHHGLVLQEKEV